MDAIKEKFIEIWLGTASGTAKFTLPQPCSIDKTNLQVLRHHSYLVCEKNDGVRHCVFFTRTQQTQEPVVYLVNRHLQFNPISHNPLTTNPNLFAGTIIDCELVQNASLVAFDCVAITGTRVAHQSLNKRVQHCKTIALIAKLQDFKIQTKQFVQAKYLRNLMKVTDSTKNDGFVFTPINQPVLTGTVLNCFKWKPSEKQTVDLVIKNTVEEGKYTLHASKDETVNTIKLQKGILLLSLQNTMGRHHNLIVECNFDQTRGWTPIFQAGLVITRTDKPNANSLYVVTRTLQAILDNIQPHDIEQVCM